MKALLKGSRWVLSQLMGPEVTPHLQAIEGRYLRIVGVRCGLACAYCVSGARKRKLHAGVLERARRILGNSPRPVHAVPLGSTLHTPETTRRVLAEVEQALTRTPPDVPLELTADDLLEFDGILEIFALHVRHQRPLRVITPGLKLADESFARACSEFGVRFTLTLPSVTSHVTDALLGRAGAHAAISQALANLQRLNVPFSLNCVVTRDNVDGLAALARFVFEELGLVGFAMPMFYPEQTLLDTDLRALRLYPSLARLNAQLEEIVDLCEGRDRRVTLIDVPPCGLSDRVTQSAHVQCSFVSHTDSPAPSYRLPRCKPCRWDPECCHLTETPPTARW
jgi:MoaA/NifB/PqqE/SkfB family radical SAM enzyme